MIGSKVTFPASTLSGRMAWSYQSVCAIGALPVSNRTKQTLLSVFRLWLDSDGEIGFSEFAAKNLIQSNGHLMPFFRFSARYKVNREKWKIEGLGKRGEEQLIKAFKHN